ncbi:hypothetical protein CerSpe_130610 [Prunus speciosa]
MRSQSCVRHCQHQPHHYDEGLTVSQYSYFPVNPKWPASRLTYAFLHGYPVEAKEPVRRAFKTWANSIMFRFTLVKNYQRIDLTIGF